jgi:hypothetical protein
MFHLLDCSLIALTSLCRISSAFAAHIDGALPVSMATVAPQQFFESVTEPTAIALVREGESDLPVLPLTI